MFQNADSEVISWDEMWQMQTPKNVSPGVNIYLASDSNHPTQIVQVRARKLNHGEN